MTKLRSLVLALIVLATALPFAAPATAQTEGTPLEVARRVEPVVLTGAQIPAWSRLAAAGVSKPFPSGGSKENPLSDEVRDAHNSQGDLVVPPDPRDATAVNPDNIAAYSYVGGEWKEIPVQVDEKFPYFLANGRSDFGFYSYTDEELSYEWDRELWNKIAGHCETEYPEGEGTMQDPATTLDDDDEIAFMADDAGELAPPDATGPFGTGDLRQQVALADPLNPSSLRFVYLFTQEGGSTFGPDHYVRYERDANADEYIDQNSFTDDSLEKLGSSNGGKGPNLPGPVCGDNLRTPDVVETEHASTDRFARDGVTVSTDSYRWKASGRWMIREMQVRKPDGSDYGRDLIDRWKGRAFQQSPDSKVSVVGFEDEQVNWEGNSSLLGELEGPVRAIREVWGADSGTNVTKTETFYRDSIAYRYRVRVHPIPPDGLYTSWDYNHDVASTYYNEIKPEGVPVDGKNDDVGQVDELGGQPAFFDANDPTFNKALSVLNWEQVSGKDDNGSLVYMFEFKNAQSLEQPLVVPYYRDDACLDDGTGDDPSPRPWPGEAQEDGRLDSYRDRPCYGETPAADPVNDRTTKQGQTYSTTADEYLQGCFACHGIHYFITGDTDNTMSPAKTTEIDGQQWQWAAPTAQPTNVGDQYANTVKAPLVASVATLTNTPEDATPTSVAVTGATGGTIGETVTLAGTLTAEDEPVAGKELVFSLRGEVVGRAVTNDNGEASVQTTLEGPAETTQQTIAFAGEGALASSSTTADFEISRIMTSLAIIGDRSGQISDPTTLAARLSTSDGPVADKELVFNLGDREVGRAVTDANGEASVQATPTAPAGTVPQSVSFAGDDRFASSTASDDYAVEQDDSHLALTSKLAQGKVSAAATLTDADSGTGLEGRTIHFFVNGKEVATAVTDASGKASATFKGKKRDTVRAAFDGDDSYKGSSAQTTVS